MPPACTTTALPGDAAAVSRSLRLVATGTKGPLRHCWPPLCARRRAAACGSRRPERDEYLLLASRRPLALIPGTIDTPRSRFGGNTVNGERGGCAVLTTTAAVRAGRPTGLDAETLKMTLEAIVEFVTKELTQERQLQLDHDDVCPEDLVRAMRSEEHTSELQSPCNLV